MFENTPLEGICPQAGGVFMQYTRSLRIRRKGISPLLQNAAKSRRRLESSVGSRPKLEETGTLYAIKVKEIWAYIKTQDILFWLVNIYLFFEYVRPQTIYPVIDVLPFAQIILLTNLMLLLFRKNTTFLSHTGNFLIGAFFLVMILSMMTALSPGAALEKVQEFIAWMIAYFLITNIINTEKRFLVFILSFLLYSFKMSQFSFKNWVARGFAFSSWGTGGGPGWFHNSGEFGIQMCVFLPLAAYFFIALKDYWPGWKKGFFLLFPFTALTGTISSSSRGALVGASAVMMWMLLKSRYKIRGFITLVLAAGLVFALLPEEQMQRFQRAGEDTTSIKRIERWKKGIEMANRYPILGVGINNWPQADREFFGGPGGLSHNIFIECMSEMGYSGLLVFLLLIFNTFKSNSETRRLAMKDDRENWFVYYMAHGLDGALVGFIVSGSFVTVLYYPYFWINFAMTVALNGIAKSSAFEQNYDWSSD